jgi:hypothetical protein
MFSSRRVGKSREVGGCAAWSGRPLRGLVSESVKIVPF